MGVFWKTDMLCYTAVLGSWATYIQVYARMHEGIFTLHYCGNAFCCIVVLLVLNCTPMHLQFTVMTYCRKVEGCLDVIIKLKKDRQKEGFRFQDNFVLMKNEKE